MRLNSSDEFMVYKHVPKLILMILSSNLSLDYSCLVSFSFSGFLSPPPKKNKQKQKQEKHASR